MAKRFKVEIEVEYEGDAEGAEEVLDKSINYAVAQAGLFNYDTDLVVSGWDLSIKEIAEPEPKPKTIRVMLSRLSRETKIVEVEAESRGEINVDDVYFDSCDEEGWEPDVDWGVEAGTHLIEDENGAFTDC